MFQKCPGQMAPRELDSVLVTCPSCGREVEFFTDEPKRRCRCGRLLTRESLPRCAEWCPAAAMCLGEAVDVRKLQSRLARIKNDPRAKACLDRVLRQLREKARRDGRR